MHDSLTRMRLGYRSFAAAVLISLGLLLGLMSGSTAAVGQEVFNTYYDVRLDPVSFNETDDKLQLELDEAIEIALRRNLGLQVERYRRARAYTAIEQSMGIFDWTNLTQSFWFDETIPSSSNLDGTVDEPRIFEGQGVNVQFEKLTGWGGLGTIDFNNQRSENNSIFSQINPSFSVDLDVTYSQPLMRGFGRLASTRGVRLAINNSDISLTQLEDAVITTVRLVEDAYWRLVEQRQQLQVAEEGLALAEELHEMNQVQVEVGTLAPLELIQSEVGIATRQEEIIRAQAAVEDAADLLRRFLNIEEERYWKMEILPSTDPLIDRIDVDLDRALEIAFGERPEIKRQRLQLDTLELDSRFFANQKKPRLDAQVRYGWNSVDGDQRFVIGDPADPIDVILVPGGYSDALEQVLDRDFVGWNVGLQFAMPLQNREAKARSAIANLALDQGRHELRDLELQIRTEVHTAARGVTTAAQQIDSATISMRLAEENLDAERKRYENGLSTSFQVLQIQEDLTQARSRLVNAITGYRRALVEYYRSIGRLLEENSIEIEDQPEGEKE